MTVCNKFSCYSLILFAVRDFVLLFLLLISTVFVWLDSLVKCRQTWERIKATIQHIYIQTFKIFFNVCSFFLFGFIPRNSSEWWSHGSMSRLKLERVQIIDVNMWRVIWYSNNCHIPKVNNTQQHHTPTIHWLFLLWQMPFSIENWIFKEDIAFELIMCSFPMLIVHCNFSLFDSCGVRRVSSLRAFCGYRPS